MILTLTSSMLGTPHSVHKKNCLDAIAAGKHVLCERPFTINEKETQEVVDAVRRKGVYVMEGKLDSRVRHKSVMLTSG